MKASEILELTADLIAIPSVSGEETAVVSWLAQHLSAQGWNVERIPVAPGRDDIFVSCGIPRILFTTHIDVVPAAQSLFSPRREGSKVIGRGACDAKGIAATMIGICSELRRRGRDNFGMLFVVGEEWDGIGAKTAAKALQHKGIQYIVNGEPTEGQLASGHKGSISLELTFKGKAAHSGYPHCGVDANAKLIRTAMKLLNTNFGEDEILGKSTVHCGMLKGGLAGNIISPSATLSCSVRTATPNAEVVAQAKKLCDEAESVELTYDCPPVLLKTIPGMKAAPVAYATDIPYFAPLGAEALLFGPGSIMVAHTDEESLSLNEIETALEGYERIYLALQTS